MSQWVDLIRLSQWLKRNLRIIPINGGGRRRVFHLPLESFEHPELSCFLAKKNRVSNTSLQAPSRGSDHKSEITSPGSFFQNPENVTINGGYFDSTLGHRVTIHLPREFVVSDPLILWLCYQTQDRTRRWNGRTEYVFNLTEYPRLHLTYRLTFSSRRWWQSHLYQLSPRLATPLTSILVVCVFVCELINCLELIVAREVPESAAGVSISFENVSLRS